MEKALVERFEAAVACLEAAATSDASLLAALRDLGDVPAASDPAIVAYDEFVAGAVSRLTAAAEKFGGKVLDATKVLADEATALVPSLRSGGRFQGDPGNDKIDKMLNDLSLIKKFE